MAIFIKKLKIIGLLNLRDLVNFFIIPFLIENDVLFCTQNPVFQHFIKSKIGLLKS